MAAEAAAAPCTKLTRASARTHAAHGAATARAPPAVCADPAVPPRYVCS